MTSRQALARAMLLGTFWTTLEVGEQQAAEGLRQAEQALDSLLSPEGVWGGRLGCSKKRMPIRRQFTYKAHKPYCLFGPVIA